MTPLQLAAGPISPARTDNGGTPGRREVRTRCACCCRIPDKLYVKRIIVAAALCEAAVDVAIATAHPKDRPWLQEEGFEKGLRSLTSRRQTSPRGGRKHRGGLSRGSIRPLPGSLSAGEKLQRGELHSLQQGKGMGSLSRHSTPGKTPPRDALTLRT